jgi:hypothetical protein
MLGFIVFYTVTACNNLNKLATYKIPANRLGIINLESAILKKIYY